MSQVVHEVVFADSSGLLAGVMTGFFLLFFFGWAAWAWWPGNRSMLEAAARLPLDDDQSAPGR